MSVAYHGSPLSLDEWQRIVAIPAAAASSGPRELCCCPNAEASYELAQLPAGGWAVKVRCAYETGDKYARQVPWRPFDTDHECVAFALSQAREHFSLELHGDSADQKRTQRRMLALLDRLFARQTPGAEIRSVGVGRPLQKPLFDL